jgi:hypothetical protein
MQKAFRKWGQGKYNAPDRLNFEAWRAMVVPGHIAAVSPLSIGHIAAGNTEIDGPASEADVLLASMGAMFHAKLRKRETISAEMKTLENGSSVSRLTSNMEIMEIVDVIRDKLAAKVKPKYALDQAQKLFHCPRSGISKKDFKLRLNKWGLLLTGQQLDTIFSMVDTEGTGRIALHDFCNFFMTAQSHPLYKASTPGKDTLDSRGRTLKFMRTQSGSMSGTMSPGHTRSKCGSTDFMAMTGSDITSAKTNYGSRKCVNQRAKKPDVTEFIKRLLKNTLAAIEAYGLYDMQPSQYLESIFLHRVVHNSKTFGETVRRDFSRPLPMPPHLISATVEAYAFGERGKGGRSVNCKMMLRDVQLWEGRLHLSASRERKMYAKHTHITAVRNNGSSKAGHFGPNHRHNTEPVPRGNGTAHQRPRSAFAGSARTVSRQRPSSAMTMSASGPMTISASPPQGMQITGEENTRRNSRRDELTAKMRQLEEKYMLSSR